MKKILLLMLMLAVAGATSCEKVQIPQNENRVSNGPNNIVDENSAIVAELCGLWIWSEDASYMGAGYHNDYSWRFYKDGTGHQTIDEYNGDGDIINSNNLSFTYNITVDMLYITYARDETAIEWHYELTGNTLITYSDMDELGRTYEFTRHADASPKFIGDWSYSEQLSNGGSIDHHMKFTSPTDGFEYEFHYNSQGKPEGNAKMGASFKYTFDETTLTLNNMGSTTTYYYRIEGTHLYLRNSKSGVEKEYVNFKKENNL